MKFRKIHAKTHSKYKGDRFIHYLTDPMDITAYVPLNELTDRGISEKWTTYILLILEIFKRGDTDLYPSKRLHPAPDFILRTIILYIIH